MLRLSLAELASALVCAHLSCPTLCRVMAAEASGISVLGVTCKQRELLSILHSGSKQRSQAFDKILCQVFLT